MNYRKAIGADLNEVKKILIANGLPSVDFGEHFDNAVVVEEKGEIIGLGGLEICGDIGLVRSIVVIPRYRGKGIAKNIYRLIEDKASHLGINVLYLLTESATEYFKKLGFTVQRRTETPIAVMETKQFKALCPSSATVMFCKISSRDE
ncbi:MAG: GNAT family N-acetyltransferase [Gammaproteobacteria bacterium]|nr:GNAT family N-acetyltransferase [Gammaproteobacteria bacterium]